MRLQINAFYKLVCVLKHVKMDIHKETKILHHTTSQRVIQFSMLFLSDFKFSLTSVINDFTNSILEGRHNERESGRNNQSQE